MATVVRYHEVGAPNVLRVEDAVVGAPGPGEVRVRHLAVGCNYADTYFRTGLYPAPLPSGIGVEGAGIVEAVGADVRDFTPGDRVALGLNSPRISAGASGLGSHRSIWRGDPCQ